MVTVRAVRGVGGGARAEPPAAAPQGVQLFFDRTGIIGTLDVNGPVNETGAFFQSLGTNGRTCATCHRLFDDGQRIGPELTE